jgi:hypothetical protein
MKTVGTINATESQKSLLMALIWIGIRGFRGTESTLSGICTQAKIILGGILTGTRTGSIQVGGKQEILMVLLQAQTTRIGGGMETRMLHGGKLKDTGRMGNGFP